MQHFIDKNIKFSLNTDDPCVMNCNFQSEIKACHDKLDFNYTQIAQFFINGAEASFLNQNDKKKLVSEIKKRTQTWLNVVDKTQITA